jgi:hypothetical protein
MLNHNIIKIILDKYMRDKWKSKFNQVLNSLENIVHDYICEFSTQYHYFNIYDKTNIKKYRYMLIGNNRRNISVWYTMNESNINKKNTSHYHFDFY